jgi:hypothetical protein
MILTSATRPHSNCASISTTFGSDQSWKGLFMNHLIKRLNFSSYLELGMGDGLTWEHVNCPVKTGVDIGRVNFVRLSREEIIHKFPNTSTDDFFASYNTNKKKDIIYIDALHTKEQVKIDFFNSIDILSDNGIIILHDINPLDPAGAGPHISGDVFVFWKELCDNIGNNHLYTFKPPRDHSQFEPVHDASHEDTVGIYIHNKESKKSLKKNYQHNTECSFALFDKHRKKYIEDKQVNFETLTDLIKNK